MSKNILIITGSPRKGGNSDMLAEAFAKGARSNGHQVSIFNSAQKDIGACKACMTCWSKGRACSFVDDFAELEPLLEQADAVVFSSPLYWFSFSTQIKAPIDKLHPYSLEKALRPLKIKESALLVCAAIPEYRVFDGIIGTYKSILEFLDWKDVGILGVPGVEGKGDIANGSALADAEALGKKF